MRAAGAMDLLLTKGAQQISDHVHELVRTHPCTDLRASWLLLHLNLPDHTWISFQAIPTWKGILGNIVPNIYIYQEDITIINIYAPNIGALRYIK